MEYDPTSGLGGMGGAQPLAATMNGAAFLGIEVDERRIKRRVETGYCDLMSRDLDEALLLDGNRLGHIGGQGHID